MLRMPVEDDVLPEPSCSHYEARGRVCRAIDLLADDGALECRHL